MHGQDSPPPLTCGKKMWVAMVANDATKLEHVLLIRIE